MRRVLNGTFGGMSAAEPLVAMAVNLRREPVNQSSPHTSASTAPAVSLLPTHNRAAAATMVAVATTTSLRFFDIKKYKLEKKRRREAELRGETLDADDDDDALPWANEEEQKKMSEEEEARKAELEELTKKMMEERDAEAKLKRQNFKKWRAEQKAKSANAKAAVLQMKAERTNSSSSRAIHEDVDEDAEKDLAMSGGLTDGDDIAPAVDPLEKRADVHRIHSFRKQVGDD